MEPVATDPHALKTSHWNSSGTYYVEAPEEKRSHKWACYFCLFILLLLIFGLAFCIFMYQRQLNEKNNVWFMREFRARCGVNGSWTSDELSTYRKYFLSYTGKNISEICTSLECYLQNQHTIQKYNNQTKDVSHFGNTVFSDWCPNRRQLYARPLRSSLAIKTRVNNNEAKHFSRNNGIASKIIFNDQLAFNETVKLALLQWMYYGNKSSANLEMFSNWESYAKQAANEYDLYDVVKPVQFEKDETFHKSYLIEEGVFATEVYLNDLAFFYQDGVLPRKICDAPFYDEIKFTVIVLGYGSDNGTSYWEVQPIGEQFKLWGNNGTMKIHDTCYKKNHTPRIIDIDLKTRQESAADEGGIPVGKFALPLI